MKAHCKQHNIYYTVYNKWFEDSLPMKKMKKKNNSVVIFTLPVAHLQAMWLNTDLVAHNRCYVSWTDAVAHLQM